MNSVCINKS